MYYVLTLGISVVTSLYLIKLEVNSIVAVIVGAAVIGFLLAIKPRKKV